MTRTTYFPVGRYTDEYCKALTENFKRDSIRSLEYNLKKDPNCTYSKDQLAKIVSDTAKLDKFRYYEGKKYLKVVRETFDEFQGRNKWRDSIRSLEYNLKKDPNCTYSKDQLAKIVSGTANLDRFRYYEGKKYLKVAVSYTHLTLPTILRV